MQIKDRPYIRDYINSIEQSFPINDWKIGGVCIWPFIRIRLYLHLVYLYEGNATTVGAKKTENSIETSIKKLGSTLWKFVNLMPAAIKYKWWLKTIKSKELLFVGNDAHRETIDGERYNRFFDVLIDEHSLHNKTAFMEYGTPSPIKKHNDSLSIGYWRGMENFKSYWFLKAKLGFRKTKFKKELTGFNDFVAFLKANEDTKGFVKSIKGIFAYIPKTMLFFGEVLDRIEPQKIMTLCYYSLEPMVLVAVANQKCIDTYEMQHGPQTRDHLAYGSWSQVPDSGYFALPRSYWCWDKNSIKAVSEWADKIQSESYKIFVGGNPWIDYWRNKVNDFQFKDYVLYSLQPGILKINELFFPALVECIRSQKFKWFIRLHPRQGGEKEMIINFLKEKDIFDLVNIEDATYNPLPLVLVNSIFHLTHFSGTAIEAGLLGKRSIILNEIGRVAFKQLIEKDGLAHFLDFKSEDFEQEFNALSKKLLTHSDVNLQVKDTAEVNHFLGI